MGIIRVRKKIGSQKAVSQLALKDQKSRLLKENTLAFRPLLFVLFRLLLKLASKASAASLLSGVRCEYLAVIARVLGPSSSLMFLLNLPNNNSDSPNTKAKEEPCLYYMLYCFSIGIPSKF
jgi:hypothetical protein